MKIFLFDGDVIDTEDYAGPTDPYDSLLEMYTDENNQLHREDGPAEIWKKGDWGYYKHGKKHRIDGPAVYKSKRFEYWIDGNKCKSKAEFIRIVKNIVFI
jgi:hypothetical protein